MVKQDGARLEIQKEIEEKKSGVWEIQASCQERNTCKKKKVTRHKAHGKAQIKILVILNVRAS